MGCSGRKKAKGIKDVEGKVASPKLVKATLCPYRNPYCKQQAELANSVLLKVIDGKQENVQQ